MERKRSSLDITRDILATISAKQGSIKPTHLMYKSNLSHKQMQGYLRELQDKELVRRVELKGHNVITITEKGYQVLQKIDEMQNFQETFGL